MTRTDKSKDHDELDFRAGFSKRLDHLLDVRGYPKKNFGRNTKLAKELGTRPAHIFKLLDGHIPLVPMLRKLVSLLGTTSDYLYGFSDKIDADSQPSKTPPGKKK